MLQHLKTWLPTYIPSALALLAIIVQAANGYVTAHPKVDMGGLLAACVIAVVNHNITAPKNSAVVSAAKEQSNGSDTSTTK